MLLQAKIFKYDEEAELNAFLLTANLYNTEKMPAVRCMESHVIVWHNPKPGELTKEMASQTILDTIRGLKGLLVEHESTLRQFAWRLASKRKRLAEIDAELEQLDKDTAAAPAGKEGNDVRQDISRKRNALKLERNGDKNDAGIITQIENGEENERITQKKVEDTKRDIDTALAYAKDLESGAAPIYGQE